MASTTGGIRIVSDFRDGQVLKLTNVGGETLIFDNEALAGTTTNSIKLPGEVDVTLKRFGTIELTYSTPNQLWICTGLAT